MLLLREKGGSCFEGVFYKYCRYYYYSLAMVDFPGRMLLTWAAALGQSSHMTIALAGPAVGIGLECWADLQEAVEAMVHFMEFLGNGSHMLCISMDNDPLPEDVALVDATARAWSAEWEDRAKADLFVAAAERHRDEILADMRRREEWRRRQCEEEEEEEQRRMAEGYFFEPYYLPSD